MPDIIDENGLQVKTATEIRADLVSGFQGIYGADINVDQNSPDGQVIGIYTQASVDVRELATSIYNNFDPDFAVGTILDQRVVINNIERAGGTFTIINITVVVDRTVTLQGLDASFNDIDGTGYTVSDNAGNQFILVDTTTITAGSHSLPFRAKNIGLVETTVGTIVNQVTIVLGVTSVNNPSAATTIGQDQELDAQLKTRRQRSVSNLSQGYLNGLDGSILNLDGVSDARVYENDTGATDSDGIPEHCIWVIVDGGANTDIANLIYEKKTAGCDMRGDVEVNITTESGALFVAKFDRPDPQDLYIQFDIQPTTASSFPESAIKQSIVDALSFSIGEFAETSEITSVARTAIIDNGGGGVAVNVEISDDDSTWVDYLEAPTLDAKWVIDTTRITITVL